MECPKCGSYYQEGEVVCTDCGAILPKKTAVITPSGSMVGAERPSVDTKALTLSALKDNASSGAFLAGVICLTLKFLVSLFMAIRGDDLRQLNNILTMLGMDTIQGGLTWLYSLLMTLGENIPLILLLVGMWMVYVQAKLNKVPSQVAFTFLTAGQVLEIVYLVVIFLVLVPILFSLDAGGTVALMVIGLLAGMFVLVIIFRYKAVRAIATAKQTVISGCADSYISIALSVFSFIMGGMVCISSIFELDISGILSGAAMIIFGVVAIGYRNSMAYVECAARNTETQVRTPVQEKIPTWKRIQMEQEQDV